MHNHLGWLPTAQLREKGSRLLEETAFLWRQTLAAGIETSGQGDSAISITELYSRPFVGKPL
jgi:hypothetical protein